MFRHQAPAYPHFRGLYSEHWTTKIYPHKYNPDLDEVLDAAREVAEGMWRRVEAGEARAVDVASALSQLSRKSIPTGPAAAVAIAAEGWRGGGGLAAQSFTESIDRSGYASYSLFIMESARRRASYRYVSAHDAREALALIVSTVEAGVRGGAPFDVGVYDVTPAGQRRKFTPMVWSGADRAAPSLKLPESMRRELLAAGAPLPERVSLADARAALASLPPATPPRQGFHL